MNRPTPMDFMALCRAIPQLAVQFARTVPPQFWSTTQTGARIDCPCGLASALPALIPVECDCDRFFLYDGANVRVARYEHSA